MAEMARSAKQFGNAVQRLRTQKGLTQQVLADLAGTGQKTISKIENGNPATRIETIFSVMAALNLELEVRSRRKNPSEDNWDDYV